VGNREDTIKKRLSDQLALERHILEAVERQRGEDSLRENLEANKVVIEIEQVLKSHVATLETLADEYGAGTSSLLKKAVTELAGVAAGLYDKVRDQEVSRMIRDDYTALSLAAMGYTAFHTFGLVIQEQRIADVALSHLKDLTPLLVRISQVLPLVVASETAKDLGLNLDPNIGATAANNTHQAWRHEVTAT
jgi:hypothetical protein